MCDFMDYIGSIIFGIFCLSLDYDYDHIKGVDDPRYPILGGRGELAAPRGLGLPRPLLCGLPQPARQRRLRVTRLLR